MVKKTDVALKSTGKAPTLEEVHPIFAGELPPPAIVIDPKSRIAIASLVQGFAQNIKAYKSKDTKEAEVRLQFIDKFWHALGWDVSNVKQVSPSDAEVIIEKNVETAEVGGLRSRRPDYMFRLGGFSRFVVEAKKPAVDIDADKDAIFQAKQYAWNSTIPFAILTDFEQFRVYDTTISPVYNEPRRGLIQEFSLDYSNYEAQWDVLTATFGRAAVEAGSLERLLARIKKIKPGRRIRTVDRMLIDLRGAEPVDQVFLAFLDAHRRHLAAAVYRENKAKFPEADTLHGAARLTEAVQRIMDRLVFMRVIEDRGIVPYGDLRAMLERIGAEGGEFYDALCATFREYDAKYNGYLYKPHFSEELNVDGSVLADFTRRLYPPDGPWDFAAIGDDILGIVYERFLGNVVTVRQNQATIEAKPEVRHAGGVYYTPRFVVDSIIRRVIGPKIKGKTPAEILNVKILDPACGSGSFLVAALQYLFDYCLDAVHADPSVAKAIVPALSAAQGSKARKKKSEIAFQDKEGRWYLAPDFRAALLTHCIHGVDIDQQAVEVTVMSLYLKMLESKLPESWATLWVERQLLPSLDNNIRCGNSLIDEEGYFRFRERAGRNQAEIFDTEDADTSFRINRFDWKSQTRGFGRILDPQNAAEKLASGFDCIIGNPPYIRVQELNQWAPEECQFYKSSYRSAAKGNYDIYVVFTERTLNLLAPDGYLGFIMPHKFWQAQYGEELRKVVVEGRHLRAVVDFRQEQVFRGATTYTAIHIFSKNPNPSGVSYAATTKLIDGASQMLAIDAGRIVEGVEFATASHPGPGAWSFVAESKRVTTLLAKSGTHPLHEVARLAQGIKTSADKVFVLEIVRKAKSFAVVKSQETEQEHEIEWKAIRPLIKSEHMKRFLISPSTKCLLFPYRRRDESFTPIPQEVWESEMPRAWKYLNQVKSVLEARESGRMEGRTDWFAYIYPKNFAVLGLPKLCIPDMSEYMQVCVDAAGQYIFSGGAAGGNAIIPNDPSYLLFFAGLLNSTLVEAQLRQTGTKFRGGYLNCEIRFIRDLPIKLPTTTGEKALADRISQAVSSIMEAKRKLGTTSLSDREKGQLASTIEAGEHRINEAVFILYGVKGLPE